MPRDGYAQSRGSLGDSGTHAGTGETHMPEHEFRGQPDPEKVQRYLAMPYHELVLAIGRLETVPKKDELELEAARRAMTLHTRVEQESDRSIDPAWQPMLDRMERVD